ncbi:hypothetical protein ACS0TY_005787 [Phlomoides rotata]
MASTSLPWVSSSKTERTSLLSTEATRPPTSVALVWKLHPTKYSRYAPINSKYYGTKIAYCGIQTTHYGQL